MKGIKHIFVWTWIAEFFFFNSLIMFGQINFSGFFDVQYEHTFNKIESNDIRIGQFEIGLQKSVMDILNIEGAIAFNASTESFELGSGYADFSLMKNKNAETDNNSLSPELGILFGQFDIPFGIDYQCISSPDRRMISPPLAVQYSIGCLNSLGIDFYGSSAYYNFDLYLFNGFTDHLAIGGRIGLLPFKDLEVGYSYLSDFASPENIIPHAFGTDFNYCNEKYEFKGELIWSQGLYEGEFYTLNFEKINKGYYLQLTHFFERPINLPLTVGIRFGNSSVSNLANDEMIPNSISRLTGLLGIEFIKNAEIKVEFSANNINTKHITHLIATQVVVEF